ncbi:MAG: YopX family protein [Defluviitaleaceae bacterium]|nr:YopX family protein [Defluviitaleaceae bacterium]
MKDRYLFRGQRLDNTKYKGNWAIGGLVSNYFGYHIHQHEVTGKDMNTHITGNFEVDPATIGQCTGLKDKNDSLIFEGDIIIAAEPNHPNEDIQLEVFTVLWYRDCWGRENTKTKEFSTGFYGSGVMEIIGNAHDNPELLESEVKLNENN